MSAADGDGGSWADAGASRPGGNGGDPVGACALPPDSGTGAPLGLNSLEEIGSKGDTVSIQKQRNRLGDDLVLKNCY